MITRRQLGLLVVLTLVWGMNWPIMKVGVSGLPAEPSSYPPLTFRAISMVLGLPVLAAAMVWMKVPFKVPRRDWAEVAQLTLSNMLVWHFTVILAIQHLNSGRAAILAYTMPIFSALWGRALYGDRLSLRQFLGVAAALLGVLLLLAHEFGKFSGAPWAALAMLVSAATWAYGTQTLRRARCEVPTVTIVFWMTTVTAVIMTFVALALEADRAQWPPAHVAGAIAYNAFGVFAFAQVVWYGLARALPPVASSISVMMIPVLGTFFGALWLGEPLHWQDWAAMALMVAAIGAVVLRR